jgi:hypothetical protein
MHVSGLSKVPPRLPFTKKPSNHCTWLVIVQAGVLPNFVSRLSFSTIGPINRDKYVNKKGKPSAGLTNKEMVDVMQRYVQVRMAPHSGTVSQRLRQPDPPRMLLLDRDSPHKTKELAQLLAPYGIPVKLLPPRSHDLMPLDSHFFGEVKNKLAEESIARHLTAEERFDYCEKLLKETEADAHIRDYHLKLLACCQAKGGRFDKELEALRATARRAQTAA